MSDSIIPSATFGLINTDDASAQASHILNPHTAYARGMKLTGSMTNRGNVSATLNAGEAYTIPAGYHAGGGVIRANSLAAQTGATATASDIISGKTAWANGSLVSGIFNPPDVDFSKLICFSYNRYCTFSLPDTPVYNTILVYLYASLLSTAETIAGAIGKGQWYIARVTGLYSNTENTVIVPFESSPDYYMTHMKLTIYGSLPQYQLSGYNPGTGTDYPFSAGGTSGRRLVMVFGV